MRLMLSAPPATSTAAMPLMICWAASAIVCRPEAQNRLTVWPGTSTGRPDRNAATRPMFRPCSASGSAQPRITSSISFGSRPRALPTAVRAADTITASFITIYSSLIRQKVKCRLFCLLPFTLISKRLAGLQDRHHSLLGLRLENQLGILLELKVEQVLLGDPLRAGEVAAAHHHAQCLGHLLVMIADIAANLHGVQRCGDRAHAAPADCIDRLAARRWRGIAVGHHLQHYPLRRADQQLLVHHNRIVRVEETHLARLLGTFRYLRHRDRLERLLQIWQRVGARRSHMRRNLAAHKFFTATPAGHDPDARLDLADVGLGRGHAARGGQ